MSDNNTTPLSMKCDALAVDLAYVRAQPQPTRTQTAVPSGFQARRPQPLPRDGVREKGHALRVSHSRSGKGVDVEGAIGTTAAVQAFDRLLSEQFRNQVELGLQQLTSFLQLCGLELLLG